MHNFDWEPKLCVRVYLILTAQHRHMGGALIILCFLKPTVFLILSPIRNRVNRKYHPGEGRSVDNGFLVQIFSNK